MLQRNHEENQKNKLLLRKKLTNENLNIRSWYRTEPGNSNNLNCPEEENKNEESKKKKKKRN